MRIGLALRDFRPGRLCHLHDLQQVVFGITERGIGNSALLCGRKKEGDTSLDKFRICLRYVLDEQRDHNGINAKAHNRQRIWSHVQTNALMKNDPLLLFILHGKTKHIAVEAQSPLYVLDRNHCHNAVKPHDLTPFTIRIGSDSRFGYDPDTTLMGLG